MATAKVLIKGEDKLKQPLNQSKQELNSFASYAQQIGKKIESALSVASIILALKKLADGIKVCVSEYAEAEKSALRLQKVWENVGEATGKSYNEIEKYSEALEKNTYFTKEAAEQSALLLAATESLSGDGFERALDASADLAAALGEDMTSAASTLAKALEDPASALTRLKTIGVTFTEEEKNQIKELTEANKLYEAQSIILDKVESKYKDVAKAINDTPAGTLDNIKDVLSDIRKDLGEGFLNALSPVLEDIYGWLLKISEWVYAWGHDGRSREYDEHFSSFLSSDIQGLLQNGVNNITDYRKLEKFIEDYNYMMSGGDQSELALGVAEALKARPGFIEDMNKIWSRMNEHIASYYAELSEAVQTAWDQGFISSDEMARLIREDLELEGDAISQDVLDFFNNLLNEWDTILSPEAQAKNKTELSNSVSDYLKDNGSMSKSMQVDNLENAITDAWNMYSKAVVGGMSTEAEYILEIINALSDKLDALTAEPDPFADTLSKYGNLSKTLQIDNLVKEIDALKVLSESAEGSNKTYFDEIIAELLKQKEALEGIEDEIPETTKTFIEKFTDSFGEFLSNTLNISSEQGGAAAGALIGTAVSNMGEAGEAVSRLAQNMATMGPMIGAIVTALQYVIEGLMEGLGDILNTFVKFGVGPLKEFGRILADALIPLFEAIMPSVEDSANMLIEIFSLIGRVLKPIITTIGNVLGPILSKITQFLERVVLPIIQMVANVFIGIATVIEWVGQWIGHLIASVINWAGGWLGIHVNDPGRPEDLDVMLANNLAPVGEYNHNGLTGSDADTASAVQNASYTGGTTVYLNVFNYGNVIGENGFEEFALIIRDKLYETNYFGK